MPTFSERYGYRRPTAANPSDLIREDAPESVRVGFLSIFEHRLQPGGLRDLVCRVLRKRPDPDNWSAYPNIWNEVQELVHRAPWPKFYDIVEAAVQQTGSYERREVVRELNELFAEEQLAWHVVDGELTLRAGDITDEVVAHATQVLEAESRPTAASELRKAMQSLSKRPEADTRDAVRCALGALEALARDITGDRSATLGEILKRKGNMLLSPPLPEAFGQIWGYASNFARHVDETRTPTLDEAVFVVGVVGAAVAFLSGRPGPNMHPRRPG